MQANFYFKNFGLSFFGTFLSYLSDPNTTAILDIGYIKLLINITKLNQNLQKPNQKKKQQNNNLQ